MTLHRLMPSTRHQLNKALDEAGIPALSMCWVKEGKKQTLACGVTDTSNPSPVSSSTVFQAASLSKPVSAAIVLDLLEQTGWDLKLPLADLEDYGPPEIQRSPHYHSLTIGMVIGQCSGLPNWFDKDSPKEFLMEPGKQFIYSGLALEFLKEVLEKRLDKKWEAIAQAFFKKAGMASSTYQQSVASDLYGKKNVAREHEGDLSPISHRMPENSEATFAAGSLLTTPTDYMTFLQYCFNNPFLKSTLLTGVTPLGDFPKTPDAADYIQWGLGMGIFQDQEKRIAFHWGNNTGSHAFFAMDMSTGDCVACFVNSENGPNVFQKLSEAVVGDMGLLFQWLSHYCAFNAASPAELSISSAKELIESARQQSNSPPGDALAVRSLLSANLGFFRNLEDKYLTEHRHDEPELQEAYDQRFGLEVFKK